MREHLLLALAHASLGEPKVANKHLEAATGLQGKQKSGEPFEPLTFWTGVEWEVLREQVKASLQRQPDVK